MLRSSLKYYDVDRKGFIRISDSLLDKNMQLEWSDVQEGRYVVIDSDGWLYEHLPDDSSRWGYRWERSSRRDIDLKMVLKNYVHGEHLTEDELNFVR